MTRPQWEFALALDRGSTRPLFLQIATALAEDICRGRLKPGDPLPSSRALARSLGVNRVTVLTAYDELHAEGWIAIERAKGAFVSPALPDTPHRRASASALRGLPPAIYALPNVPTIERWPAPRPGVLLLNSWPDTRLVRVEPLARAFRRVLRRDGPRVLAYGDPLGHPSLRQNVAEMVSSSRGLAAGAEEVMITRGSQMALSLLARAFLGAGKVVAVESPGYPFAWHTFRLAEATVVPIPVDREGFDVAALERAAAAQRIDAVYLTPHHQFPTTVTMSASRRAQLLALVQRQRMLVIEDDYDDAFQFDALPVTPLASLDTAGVVAYVGTFSKVFAPGLRIGYVVAPRPVLDRLAALRQFDDIHGDAGMEAAVASLLEESEVQRHIRRVRAIYQQRRDRLADLLRALPGHPVSFDVPRGGVALWVRVAPEIDVDEWARVALERGVGFLTGRRFSFDGRKLPFARLGFASVNETEIPIAVKRLEAALPKRRASSKSRRSRS